MAEVPLSAESLAPLRGDPDALIAIIVQQSRVIVEQRELIVRQQEAIKQLNERVADLEKQLEDSGRGGAAPFRIPDKKRRAKPKRPGQRKGHKGHYRRKPEKADLTIEVPLERCPECGAAIEEAEVVEQHIIDLPPIKPLIIRLRTQRGHCPCCGEDRASSHPLQVSTATGAAGTHLGIGSLSAAAQLRYEAGLTMRTTCQVLGSLLNLPLTPGGLSQAMDRVADRLEGDYDHLIQGLLDSGLIHTDETGWWLEDGRAALWVKCNPKITVYRVVAHKDRATFHEVVPPDWFGVLVSDCLSVYDNATPLQHKCYAHHLKAISQAQENLAARSSWLEQIRSLLKGAIALSKEREHLSAEQFEQRVQACKTAARALLTEQPRPCPHEESVRNRLWKQRDHLFVFLEHEGVDATNNLAERQLRPAVIRRKLSCGNKSQRGARSFEILASLAATCRQSGERFLDKIAAAMPLSRA